MQLYHGTSTSALEQIIQEGYLKNAYLTSDLEQAEYYSQCAAEDSESNEIILIVNIDENQLHADLASFNEPLSYILNQHDMSEEDWHESIENGSITYPEIEDWKTSLHYVFSVKHPKIIPIQNIDYSGDNLISDEEIENIEKIIFSVTTNVSKKII